jgi:predicted dehydrogenase
MRASVIDRSVVTQGTWQTIASQRPLRGVVVGAGGLGPAWARELLEHSDTELVAWVDRDHALVRRKARALGQPRLQTSSDVDPILVAEAPDFVVNVTPPLAHGEITLPALEHGAAVLSEKPMAATMHAAREMVATADRTHRLLMVSQNRRYLAP